MKFHPHDLLLLETFGSLTREQRRPVLEHLEQCTRCRERLRTLHRQRSSALFKRIAGLTKPLRSPGDYDSALDQAMYRFRSRQCALEQERSEAVDLYAKLLEESPEHRKVLVRKTPKFQTWGLLELVLDEGRRAAQKAPTSGEPLVRLALTLADHLEAAYYGQERIDDLRARAWSVLGNTLRLKSELPSAEAAFDIAERYLRRGTGDPLERAEFSELKASLRRTQKRFEDAMALLKRPLATYTEAEDWHRAGRVLVGIGVVHHDAGRPPEGIPLLNQALNLIDGNREPFLLLCTLHNLADDLAKSSRIMAAQAAFMRARPLYATSHERGMQNKGYWLEGRIAQGLGQYPKAEALLLRARDGLSSEGLTQESALAEGELKVLWATMQQKRPRGRSVI